MKYKNGYIYLEQQEVEILSFMLFNDKMNLRYDSQEFIGSLKESEALLLEEKARYALMQDRGKREAILVDMIDITIAACETYIEMAHTAAKDAGTKIEFH